MKKIATSLLLIFTASVTAHVHAGTAISQSQLPKVAQTFLSKYFPTDRVVKIEKEQGRRGVEYDVDLTSGAEVDFTDAGQWKDIKAAKGCAVPAAIIPVGIIKYVSANYPERSIREISRRRGGYEVELSNGTELHLTADGKLMQSRRGSSRSGR